MHPYCIGGSDVSSKRQGSVCGDVSCAILPPRCRLNFILSLLDGLRCPPLLHGLSLQLPTQARAEQGTGQDQVHRKSYVHPLLGMSDGPWLWYLGVGRSLPKITDHTAAASAAVAVGSRSADWNQFNAQQQKQKPGPDTLRLHHPLDLQLFKSESQSPPPHVHLKGVGFGLISNHGRKRGKVRRSTAPSGTSEASMWGASISQISPRIGGSRGSGAVGGPKSTKSSGSSERAAIRTQLQLSIKLTVTFYLHASSAPVRQRSSASCRAAVRAAGRQQQEYGRGNGVRDGRDPPANEPMSGAREESQGERAFSIVLKARSFRQKPLARRARESRSRAADWPRSASIARVILSVRRYHHSRPSLPRSSLWLSVLTR